MRNRVDRWSAPACAAPLFCGLLAIAAPGQCATVTYSYDALGRLVSVQHDNGYVSTYAFDPVGNRLAADEQPPPPPSAPPFISVPANSATAIFTVSWGVATGTPTRYEFYESPNSTFATQTLLFNALATTTSLVQPNGPHFYRVRACNAGGCGAYSDTDATLVFDPRPGVPLNPRKSLVANCGWGAYWSPPTTGTGSPVVNYVVRDIQGATQTVTTTTAYVNCPYNNSTANYPKDVSACAAGGFCSAPVTFP